MTGNMQGKTALIIPPKDAGAISKAILELSTLPDHGKQMGEQGRIIVQEQFSIKVITQNTSNLFEELVGV